MRIRRVALRVNAVNPEHVHCTLFIDGFNNGKLVFNHEEYKGFSWILTKGCPAALAAYISDDSLWQEYQEKEEEE